MKKRNILEELYSYKEELEAKLFELAIGEFKYSKITSKDAIENYIQDSLNGVNMKIQFLEEAIRNDSSKEYKD